MGFMQWFDKKDKKPAEIETREVVGEILRCNTMTWSEFSVEFIFMLKGDPAIYYYQCSGGGVGYAKSRICSLAQPGDEVAFTIKEGQIIELTNRSLARIRGRG